MARTASISEETLHEFWLKQRIPETLLRTSAGETITVINPGRYNKDSGPDFRCATLHLGDRIQQGDVELHLNAADWQSHGHHVDSAYNEVILHVAIADLSADSAILRENGLPVPQLLLPLSLLEQMPSEQPLLFPCPLSQTTTEKIFAAVRVAGVLRLQAKAHAFAEQLLHCSWDQAVYRGLAEAFGYDKNQEPFRRLAELVPIDLLFGELRAARTYSPEILVDALLFGAAGFLDRWVRSDEVVNADTTAFLEERWRIWDQLRHTLQLRPMRPESWQFFRLRPQNFPTRRLAALNAMVRKFYRQGIFEHLAALFQALVAEHKSLVLELINFFTCPAQGFWRNHYHFRDRGYSGVKGLGDLIGRDRAMDILVNLVLPALWHHYGEAGNSSAQNQALEVYAALPKLQENAVTRAMRKQLSQKFPVSRSVAPSARSQQGLIHLQRVYCRPMKCSECLELEA